MLSHFRRNAVAYLALFVAMSGTAYAATVARNTVNSGSIINGEVRTVDLADGAVTPAKIASVHRIRLDGLLADDTTVFSAGGEEVRYSGVLVIQSGKLVETLTFHAFVGGAGTHYCQLFGTLLKT